MMITLFQQRSKPFYKFGATMELGTIPAKGWIPYLRRQFAAEGRELPEPLAEKIFTKVELHSSYVQQLAFNVLVCTSYVIKIPLMISFGIRGWLYR